VAAAQERSLMRAHYPVGPLALFGAATGHASLLWQFARREIAGRYRGSLLGFGWAVLNPLLLLAIYTFVFSVVFRMRWDVPVDNRLAFALIIYTGMIVHGFVAECMTRAPTLVVDNRNLVKRVVFPLHLLPWSVLLVAAFHYAVGLVLVLAAVLVTTGTLPATAIALPLLWVPQALLALGVAYAFAALGVYLRDLAQVAGFLSLALLFASPVFYPLSAVPEAWRFVVAMNPLAALIEATRAALLYGTWPDAATVAGLWVLGGAVAWLGFFWFQRTRRGFADVL
jgi:lipopolysaccharide transport system permease protein